MHLSFSRSYPVGLDFSYSETCLKRPLEKKTRIGFHDRSSLNAGLLTFIKSPFVITIFVVSILEWPRKTGFTVFYGNNSPQSYFVCVHFILVECTSLSLSPMLHYTLICQKKSSNLQNTVHTFS